VVGGCDGDGGEEVVKAYRRTEVFLEVYDYEGGAEGCHCLGGGLKLVIGLEYIEIVKRLIGLRLLFEPGKGIRTSGGEILRDFALNLSLSHYGWMSCAKSKRFDEKELSRFRFRWWSGSWRCLTH